MEVEKTDAATSRVCARRSTRLLPRSRNWSRLNPKPRAMLIVATGRKLASLLLEHELALAEINPLFVSAFGCVAGDAKVVVDLNAVERSRVLPH